MSLLIVKSMVTEITKEWHLECKKTQVECLFIYFALNILKCSFLLSCLVVSLSMKNVVGIERSICNTINNLTVFFHECVRLERNGKNYHIFIPTTIRCQIAYVYVKEYKYMCI